MLKTDVDINSDDNADWIKLVHGGKAQKKELATHRKLDREKRLAKLQSLLEKNPVTPISLSL